MDKLFTLFMIFLSFSLCAQQSPQSSLYNHNIYNFNPAVAGINGELSVNGDIRRQWVGLSGAPLTQSVNANLPVYFTKGGFGLSFKNLTYGVSQNLEASVSYNQILQLNEQSTLSFGVSGGIMQHNFAGSELRTPDGTYEPGAFDHRDLQLLELDANASAPILSFGVILDYNNLRVGVSADNLLESTFELSDNQNNVVLNQIRHYYGYISYELGKDNDLSLTPSVFIKAGSAEIQTDINVTAEINEKFLLGVSYRGYSNLSNDALVFQGGFRLNNNMRLIYAYDFGLSELKTAHSGSHELLISYNLATNFGKGNPPQIIYNPRFL